MNLIQARYYGQQILQDCSPSAPLDARVLLGFVCRLTPEQLLTETRELSVSELDQYKGLLAQRQQQKPIAYLVGEKEFWSLVFKVTDATLIPRPDTETLVEYVLQHHPAASRYRVLELGTGCGAIAVSLAHERSHWQFLATDIDPACLQVAAENAQCHGVQNVDFLVSDWYSQLTKQRFDLIVSNPPYVGRTQLEQCSSSTQFEPPRALFSDDMGLADLKTIIEQAKAHLLPNGWLVLEHGFQQAQSVQKLMERAGFNHLVTVRDLANNERVTAGQS